MKARLIDMERCECMQTRVYTCSRCGGYQDDDIELVNKVSVEEYYELIMAVESAYEGETRHQTALRYIMEAEKGSDIPCKQSTNS